MKKTEKAILIEGLRKLSADAAQIADALEGKAAPVPGESAQEEAPETGEAAQAETPAPMEQAVKEVTYEEMRAALAEKSRAGFKAEVKALLTAHGVDHLSKITDPAERTAVIKEAEVIGNG